jgi:hypothetical protein
MANGLARRPLPGRGASEIRGTQPAWWCRAGRGLDWGKLPDKWAPQGSWVAARWAAQHSEGELLAGRFGLTGPVW